MGKISKTKYWTEKHPLAFSGGGKKNTILKRFLRSKLPTSVFVLVAQKKNDTLQYALFKTAHYKKIIQDCLPAVKKHYPGVTEDIVSLQNVTTLPLKKLKLDETDDEVEIKKGAYTYPFEWMESLREPYKQQIQKKSDNVHKQIDFIYKKVSSYFPIYNTLLKQKVKEHDGLICPVDQFRECPLDKQESVTCSLEIGKDETKEFVVGLDRKYEIKKPLSMVFHNYAEHVVNLAQVFQVFLEKTSTYLSGENKLWDKLIVRTNSSKEIMLTVLAYATRFSNNELKKKLISDLKEFFEQGKGKKCCVTTLYFRLVNEDGIPEHRVEDADLIIGSPFIEDEVVGLKLRFPPMKMLWTSLYGAEMLCKAIEEILIPTKKLSVLEVGCETGIIGLYLSKLVGEVLSIDSGKVIETAEKNKELNGMSNCTYFEGNYVESIPEAAKKLAFDTVYAIVIISKKRSSSHPRVLTELRRIEKLKKILLVVEMSMNSPLGPVLSLSRPTKLSGKGNPFLPVRALPVDTMPNSKGNILLILLERINLDSLPGIGKWKLNYLEHEKETFESGMTKKNHGRNKKKVKKQLKRKMKHQNSKKKGQNFNNRVLGSAQFHGSLNTHDGYSHDNLPNNLQQDMYFKERKMVIKEEDTQRWLKRSQNSGVDFTVDQFYQNNFLGQPNSFGSSMNSTNKSFEENLHKNNNSNCYGQISDRFQGNFSGNNSPNCYGHIPDRFQGKFPRNNSSHSYGQIPDRFEGNFPGNNSSNSYSEIPERFEGNFSRNNHSNFYGQIPNKFEGNFPRNNHSNSYGQIPNTFEENFPRNNRNHGLQTQASFSFHSK